MQVTNKKNVMDYSDFTRSLSDLTSRKEFSLPGRKQPTGTYKNLGLDSILSHKRRDNIRKALRKGENPYLKSIIKLLVIDGARNVGSIEGVKEVTIKFTKSRPSNTINILDLPKLRSEAITQSGLANMVNFNCKYVSTLEQNMRKLDETSGLFNIRLETIYKYATALNVDAITIPTFDGNGKMFEFISRRKNG